MTVRQGAQGAIPVVYGQQQAVTTDGTCVAQREASAVRRAYVGVLPVAGCPATLSQSA